MSDESKTITIQTTGTQSYTLATGTWNMPGVTYTISYDPAYNQLYVLTGAAPMATTPAIDPSRFPHKCPRCGGAAYIGLDVDHATKTDCA